MGILKKILLFLLVLETVLAIHEYGHYAEFKKKGIPIEEFALGIGPAIYQKKLENFTFSFRLIPIMAYVAPKREAVPIIKKLEFRDKFIIYSAGVRNGVVSGTGAVFILNVIGWRKGHIDFVLVAKRLFAYPTKVILMFFLYFLDFVTLGKFKLVQYLQLRTARIEPPQVVKSFIFCSFLVALFNLMPIYPYDGGKLFIEFMSATLSPKALSILQLISQGSIFLFIFRGFPSLDKFIDYEN